MNLGNLTARLGGRRIVFDGAAERIPNDPEADLLLSRSYREPFVVRDHI